MLPVAVKLPSMALTHLEPSPKVTDLSLPLYSIPLKVVSFTLLPILIEFLAILISVSPSPFLTFKVISLVAELTTIPLCSVVVSILPMVVLSALSPIFTLPAGVVSVPVP